MIMKKFMKIAAVAAAVLAMLVSCEEKEKTPLTVEGKQWIVTFEDFTDGDIPGVIDLGYTEAGKISFGVQREGVWEETGYMDMAMPYTIEKLTETSGVISYTYTMNDMEFTEKIPYSELTETTVKFSEWVEDPMETSLFWYKYDETATVSTSAIIIKLIGE